MLGKAGERVVQKKKRRMKTRCGSLTKRIKSPHDILGDQNTASDPYEEEGEGRQS